MFLYVMKRLLYFNRDINCRESQPWEGFIIDLFCIYNLQDIRILFAKFLK